ncbi:unnamed protein product [Peniophora sp. CBMAI 1063]|nr:unnamed protein product [Peniophora sp. CBMAI 1063]
MTGNHHGRKSLFNDPPQPRPMRGGKTAYSARSSNELAQDSAIVLTLHTERAVGAMLAAEGIHQAIHPGDFQADANVVAEGAQLPPDEVAQAGAQAANGPAGGDAQAADGLADGGGQAGDALAGGDAQEADGLAGGDAQANDVAGGQAAPAQNVDKRGAFKRLSGFVKQMTGKAFRGGR